MARVIRARLEGPHASLGDVAASDVARLIIGLERAIAQAAYVALGRPRGYRTGRHRGVIEAASRLRFVGAETGSLVGVLALPDSSAPAADALPMTVQDLSSLAVDTLIASIDSGSDPDPRLAGAVAQLAEDLGIGDRNELLRVETDHLGDRRATLDRTTRQRMRYLSRRPLPSRRDTVVGRLVEADFERRTARVRTAEERSVTVSFPAEMADEIHSALRGQAQFQGVVTFDARTATAVSVALEGVTSARQLLVGDTEEDFWTSKPFRLLMTEQQVAEPQSLRQLYDERLTDEERAAFTAALETSATGGHPGRPTRS